MLTLSGAAEGAERNEQRPRKAWSLHIWFHMVHTWFLAQRDTAMSALPQTRTLSENLPQLSYHTQIRTNGYFVSPGGFMLERTERYKLTSLCCFHRQLVAPVPIAEGIFSTDSYLVFGVWYECRQLNIVDRSDFFLFLSIRMTVLDYKARYWRVSVEVLFPGNFQESSTLARE